MTPTQQPLAPEHPHLADYCDEIEHAEVARILSELSAEHPARVAYATGARQVSDSISLSWLVADQHDIVQALTNRTWPPTVARLPGRQETSRRDFRAAAAGDSTAGAASRAD